MALNWDEWSWKSRKSGPQTLNPPVAWWWLIFYLSGVAAGCPFIEPSFAQQLGLNAAIPKMSRFYLLTTRTGCLLCRCRSFGRSRAIKFPIKPRGPFIQRTSAFQPGLVTTCKCESLSLLPLSLAHSPPLSPRRQETCAPPQNKSTNVS